MPEEAVCPTCGCTVVVTQQGTCPMGHPIDAAAVKAASPPAPAPAPAPEAAAPVTAAGAATAGAVAAEAGAAAAPQQAPGAQQPQDPAVPTGDTSTLPPPGESDFLSGPAPEPTAAQKPKRKTSPVFVILLVLILILVVVAAVVVVFFPEMIGLAMAVPALVAVT